MTTLNSAGVTGLSAQDVASRVAAGKVNRTKESSSRTFGQILRGNIFTLFNGILAVAIVVVLAVGQLQDAVFGLVIVVNAAIGVIQEYRAKRTLDNLAVLNAPRVVVVRDGRESEIDAGDLVIDDVYRLRTGDQVPADSEVLESHGLEIDESLLTGESDPVDKLPGDQAMSGSFLVSGSATVRATSVGADSYANQLTAQARKFSLVQSELRNGVNKILVWVTWIIGPVIIALMWSQIRAHGGWSQSLSDGSWRDAVVGAVAGVVGMIPEGLVLLTSISFGLAAVTLARRKVLVQELPAVEVLARVDVICLDKTGTLTAGEIVYDRLELLGSDASTEANHQVTRVLLAIGDDPQANATAHALGEASLADAGAGDVGSKSKVPDDVTYDVPFSSARKWSALTVDGEHWVFGGPDVVLHNVTGDEASRALDVAASSQADGARALLLARVSEIPTAEGGVIGPVPVAIVLFREKVRPDAAETLRYFEDQGVELRIISGDNPVTVAAIAREVGLEGAQGFDARELPEDQAELAQVLEDNRVFGRVTPEQKRAIVHALQSRGHVVAMTGDGVNDALALKDADLGIAMGAGAGATKAVARVVLLDNQFSRLPGVVAEGRRVIANVERVANLFLTKTTYAVLLALTVSVIGWAYPFLPRHLSVVSALTIGVPAFFLALAPNKQRYRSGFLGRVLAFAVPSGIIAAIMVMAVYVWCENSGHEEQVSTVATITLIWIGLWVLGVLCRPWVWWRIVLVAAMAGGALLVMVIPFLSTFYKLAWPSGSAGIAIIVGGVLGSLGVELAWRFITPRLIARSKHEAPQDA